MECLYIIANVERAYKACDEIKGGEIEVL